MDWDGIGRVAANTTLAACAGGMVAVLFVYPRSKKWDVGMSLNGFLGGLVAITAPCYWVSPPGPIIIGAVAGIVVALGVDLLEQLRIDDPIGAVPVHCSAASGARWRRPVRHGQYGIPTAHRRRQPQRHTVKGLFYGGNWDSSRPSSSAALTCDRRRRRRRVHHLQAIRPPRHLEPAGRAGRRARGHRHPRARHPRLPRGVRPGHDLHHPCRRLPGRGTRTSGRRRRSRSAVPRLLERPSSGVRRTNPRPPASAPVLLLQVRSVRRVPWPIS